MRRVSRDVRCRSVGEIRPPFSSFACVSALYTVPAKPPKVSTTIGRSVMTHSMCILYMLRQPFVAHPRTLASGENIAWMSACPSWFAATLSDIKNCTRRMCVSWLKANSTSASTL